MQGLSEYLLQHWLQILDPSKIFFPKPYWLCWCLWPGHADLTSLLEISLLRLGEGSLQVSLL